MKYLETSGIPITQIKGIPRIPMCKKIMKMDDYMEFIDMVISFAERKSMTISNIKDAIQEIVTYLEEAATLNIGLEGRAYREEDGVNAKVKLKLEQKKSDVDSKDGKDGSKVREKIHAGKDKDEVMAERIFDLLLESCAADGISVKEVEAILRRVYKMFVYTTIVPIAEDRTRQLERKNVQTGGCDIDEIATALSQKIQEFALK